MFDMVDSFVFADLPDNVIGFTHALPFLAKAIARGGPVKIVAMGSSSTAGRADVVPYPYRLEIICGLSITMMSTATGGSTCSTEAWAVRKRQLHQSDASTQRLARGLCDTVVKAVAAVPTT
jgi:hypothetical protein